MGLAGAVLPGCDIAASAAQRALDRVCWTNAYPLMSSHTAFRGLALQQNGTSVKDWRPSEFDRTPRQIEYIRLSGGIIAPFVGQEPGETPQTTSGAGAPEWRLNDADDLEFAPGDVANTCAGTSRGWMNSFYYGAAKMHGDPLEDGQLNLDAGGVAMSTDWPLVGGPGPRFRAARQPFGRLWQVPGGGWRGELEPLPRGGAQPEPVASRSSGAELEGSVRGARPASP